MTANEAVLLWNEMVTWYHLTEKRNEKPGLLVKKEVDAIEIVLAEIERLQAIVDKLPTTADGVPIVPGMRVYFRCSACNGAIESMVPINSVSDRMSKTFYSTHKAAEAAGGE